MTNCVGLNVDRQILIFDKCTDQTLKNIKNYIDNKVQNAKKRYKYQKNEYDKNLYKNILKTPNMNIKEVNAFIPIDCYDINLENLVNYMDLCFDSYNLNGTVNENYLGHIKKLESGLEEVIYYLENCSKNQDELADLEIMQISLKNFIDKIHIFYNSTKKAIYTYITNETDSIIKLATNFFIQYIKKIDTDIIYYFKNKDYKLKYLLNNKVLNGHFSLDENNILDDCELKYVFDKIRKNLEIKGFLVEIISYDTGYRDWEDYGMDSVNPAIKVKVKSPYFQKIEKYKENEKLNNILKKYQENIQDLKKNLEILNNKSNDEYFNNKLPSLLRNLHYNIKIISDTAYIPHTKEIDNYIDQANIIINDYKNYRF